MDAKNRYLRMPLLRLSEADVWRGMDAFQGVQVFGATGAGKSSGSGKAIALAMLRAGFGGLVLSAKGDDLADWLDYVKATSRGPDLVILGLATPEARAERLSRAGTTTSRTELLRQVPVVDSFAFLDYCRGRAPKGISLTLELVNVFLAALAGDGAESTTVEPYWNDALRELLTHAIDLSDMASGRVDLHGLVRAVRTAPQTEALVATHLEAAEKSPPSSGQDPYYCVRLLHQANGRVPVGSERRKDLEDTAYYWLRDFPGLSPKTRSIIVSTFTSKVAGLLRSPLRQLLDAEGPANTAADPEATHRGRIVFVDLPIKEFGGVGRLAQVIYKTVWQRSTEKRSLAGDSWRPVFLWADESQYFVTPYDQLFQQTARSKFAATVFLTQNLPNYYAAIGGARFQAATESLLGNLQTKIFHANGDPATNEWASRVFGTAHVPRASSTIAPTGPSQQVGTQVEPIVHSSAFTVLRRGGSHEPGSTVAEAEAIIYAGGKIWDTTGRTYVRVLFNQDDGSVRVGKPHDSHQRLPG